VATVHTAIADAASDDTDTWGSYELSPGRERTCTADHPLPESALASTILIPPTSRDHTSDAAGPRVTSMGV